MSRKVIRKLAESLSGEFVQIGFQADVINRISRVILFRSDKSFVAILNEMVDDGNRVEIGQLRVVDGKSNFTEELAVKLDYSPGGIKLASVWMKESSAGDIVSGLAFGDYSGGEIDIIASVEVECLHVNVGALRTPSDPEYPKDEYRIVRP